MEISKIKHKKALKLLKPDIGEDVDISPFKNDEDGADYSVWRVTLDGEAFVLKKAKEQGLHICMETCGHVNREVLARSAEYVDLYLFDYKETDAEKHRAYTGVDNSLILENLRYLNSIGKQIVLRCPIIPDFNDTKEHFDGIASIANELDGIVRVELEPYHDFGCGKYEHLGKILNGKVSKISAPKKEEITEIEKYIQNNTRKSVTSAQ